MKRETIKILRRGLRQVCPACGKTPLFDRRFQLRESCPECGLEIRSRDTNTWLFMYVSTAAISGIFLFIMFAFKFSNPVLARVILIGTSIPVFFSTIHLRKSLAIALDYLIPGG